MYKVILILDKFFLKPFWSFNSSKIKTHPLVVKSSVEKKWYSNSLNDLQLQRLSIIVTHSPRGLIFVTHGLQWHMLIGTCRLLLLTIDCIQLRQATWVLASWQWADFSPPYIVGKMYEHRTWSKLKKLSCCTLPWFWQIKYSSQRLRDC